MADLLALADDETAALWAGLRLGYSEAPGHPLLRAEIANLYDTIGADEVLVFAGAEEAIFCLSNVLLGPGDHAVVTWPGYQSLYEVGRGGRSRRDPPRAARGRRLGLDPDRLIAASARRRVSSSSTRRTTRRACCRRTQSGQPDRRARRARDPSPRRRGLPLPRIRRGRSADRRRGRVRPRRLARRMSKSFAMAGLRIGWLATRDRELLARCAAFKDYTTICSSAPSEILALIGLRARDTVLARSRRIVSDNLVHLDGFFEAHGDRWSWVRPRGGSIGFARLLDDEPSESFAARLVETEGVLLLPGSVDGARRQSRPDRVRARGPAGGRRAARGLPGADPARPVILVVPPVTT